MKVSSPPRPASELPRLYDALRRVRPAANREMFVRAVAEMVGVSPERVEQLASRLACLIHDPEIAPALKLLARG
jgi:hypothetical protein